MDGAGLAAESGTNDGTIRAAIWRRYGGDDWAAFDQLPAVVRRRLAEHAYDAWSVNALILWRHFRRLHPTAERAQRALLRYLDYCERLERRAFADRYAQLHGAKLPHLAAGVSVLRYDVTTSKQRAARHSADPRWRRGEGAVISGRGSDAFR